MKKFVSAVLALVMVLSVSAVAFAAETFVPSISYKDAPEIVVAQFVDSEGKVEEITDHCLLVTPVAKAIEGDVDSRLPVENKDLLISVYQQLNNGTMKLPADKLVEAGLEVEKATIRELVDISWVCEEDPSHLERLGAEQNTQLKITFKLPGVNKGEKIAVMTYKNDEWAPIADVTVDEDYMVTCTFTHLCPVAFVVGPDALPGTGVKLDPQLVIWSALLVASAAALVVVVCKRRRNAA